MGFPEVYDYASGKVDWMAAGLRTVRADPVPRRALDAADRTPLTCRPETTVATAARVAREAGQSSVVVVNDAGIVLGRVGERELAGDPDVAVETVMQPGPSTVRAHEPLDELLERMASRNVTETIVTTPEGHLLGVVHRPPPGNAG